MKRTSSSVVTINKPFLTAFFIIIFILLLPHQVLAITTHNLTDSIEYNLRFDGSAVNDYAGWYRSGFGDIDNNGKADMLVGAFFDDNNGANTGSLYVIYDSLLDQYIQNNSKHIDLNNSSNYNLRIDGAAYGFAYDFNVKDITNDNLNDLIITDNGRTYIIPNSVISGFETTTGNSFNLSDTTKWTYKIEGYEDSYTNRGILMDYNNDGKVDIVISRPNTAYNGNRSGSFFIINNDLISSTASTGNTLDITNADNYTVRIDGPSATAYKTFSTTVDLDIDGNGTKEIAVADSYYNTQKGATWIIKDTTVTAAASGSKRIDLSDNSTYILRIDGAFSGAWPDGAFSSLMASNNISKGLLISGKHVSGGLSHFYFLSYGLLQTFFDSSGVSIGLDQPTSYTFKYPGNSFSQEVDFNNDGIKDLITNDNRTGFTGSNFGSVYIVNGTIFDAFSDTGHTLDLDTSAYTLTRFDGAAAYTHLKGADADFNGDGKYDLVFGTDWAGFNSRSRSGSYWYILNFPHTISLNTLPAWTSTTSIQVTGTITASQSVTTIAGVQWSYSNNPSGSWNNCSANDGNFNSTREAFTCIVNGYTEENKTYYIRAYDQNGSYTAQNQYASNSFSADLSNPASSNNKVTVTDSGTGKTYEKYFVQTTIDEMSVESDTEFPKFCFTKAYDNDHGSGIQSYTLRLDGKNYITDIPYISASINEYNAHKDGNRIIKEYDDYVVEYINYDKLSEKQEVCVYGKREKKKLYPGFHLWNVFTTDHAGNMVQTGERKFLVKTNTGVYGGSGDTTAGWGDYIGPGAYTTDIDATTSSASIWFPLALLSIGEIKTSDISTSIPKLFKTAYTIYSPHPVLYGIAQTSAKIKLTIEEETEVMNGATGKPEKKRTQIVTKETSANEKSRWGINIDAATYTLKPNTQYYLTISAEYNGKLALIKDIPIKIAGLIDDNQSVEVTDSAVLENTNTQTRGTVLNLLLSDQSEIPFEHTFQSLISYLKR